MRKQGDITVNIVWPEPTQIVSPRRKNPTLQYIQKLCNGVGITSLLIFLFFIKVLRPLLDEKYEQRRFLAASIILKARRLVAALQEKFSHTAVATFDFEKEGSEYVSRAIQTDEIKIDSVDTEEARGPKEGKLPYVTDWVAEVQKLQNLKADLEDFNLVSLGGSISVAVEDLTEHTENATRLIQRSYVQDSIESHSDDIVGIIREMKAKCIRNSFR